MSNIKDVARLAGVSISTVSNVLNSTKFVSEELRAKVLFAAKELNYEANPIAHSMKNKKSKTIGIITANMCDLFYPYIVRAIDEVLSSHGYNIIIFDSHSNGDIFSTIHNEKRGFKKLIANKVDGIIFTSSVPENLENAYFKSIRKLIAASSKKIELVSILRNFTKHDVTSVFTDTFSASSAAVEHLFSEGCKNIGHITGPDYLKVSSDRLHAFKTVVTSRGIPYNEKTMVAFGDFSHQSGYMNTKLLLKANPSIDGIFAANDQMAVGVLKALSEAGKKVPGDIKVIGYDNAFISSILEPSLSTVDVDKIAIGQKAAAVLLEQMETKDSADVNAKEVIVPHKLVIRKSTSPDAPEDWITTEW